MQISQQYYKIILSPFYSGDIGLKGLKYLAQGHPPSKYPYCDLYLGVSCSKVLALSSSATLWR